MTQTTPSHSQAVEAAVQRLFELASKYRHVAWQDAGWHEEKLLKALRAELASQQEVAAPVEFGPDEDGIVWPVPAMTTPSPNLAEYFSAPQVRAMIAASRVPVASLAEPTRWHELKTDPDAFDAVMRGEKTCEIRRNDRNFNVGDGLLLRRTKYTGNQMHMRPEQCPLVYTGEECRRVISHVLTGYGLEDNCALSFATPPMAVGAVGGVGARKETDQRDKMLDARRYETLRHCRGQEHDPLFCVRDEEGNAIWGGDLDDALDEAIAYEQDIYGEDADREALKKGSPALLSARDPDEEVMEQIAAQWDGCFCDIAAVGKVDIGAAIRDDWKRYNGLAPEQATTGSGQDSVDAQRYRFLRDGPAYDGWFPSHYDGAGFPRHEICLKSEHRELDEAIDAAILSTASPAGELAL